MDIVTEKKCNRCERVLDAIQFRNDITKTDGKSTLCKDCKSVGERDWYLSNKERTHENHRVWRAKNPNKSIKDKKYRIKKDYGITVDEYDGLYNSQNGKCAICGNTSENRKNMHLDHNHKNGKIRGFLCVKCNTGIGFFNEDIEIFRNAIKYLESYD